MRKLSAAFGFWGGTLGRQEILPKVDAVHHAEYKRIFNKLGTLWPPARTCREIAGLEMQLGWRRAMMNIERTHVGW